MGLGIGQMPKREDMEQRTMTAAETAFPGHRLFLIGTLAWLLTAYAVATTVALLVEARATPAAAPP